MPPRPKAVGPERDSERIRAAVSRYGAELLPRMRGPGQSEQKLRQPTHGLLRDVGRILGPNVVVHDEVPLGDLSCRPDFAVDTPAGCVG
jgi:hypothetical protein